MTTPHAPTQPEVDKHVKKDVFEIIGWAKKQLIRSLKVHDMLQEDKIKDKQDTSIEDSVIPPADPLIEDKVQDKEEQLEGIKLQSKKSSLFQEELMQQSFMFHLMLLPLQ